MSKNETVYIVIPSFNEQQVIKDLILQIKEEGFEKIVVVDDASDTPLSAILSDIENLKILRHRINCGAGAASQTGMAYALENGAEHLVLMDADGQHQASEINKLLYPVISGKYDIAIGSRFIGSNRESNVPWIKRVALKVGYFFTWFISGVSITDSQNGFKAMNRKAAGSMKFLFNRFEFCLEIIDLIKINKLRYTEVPVTVKYTEYSMKKGQKLTNALTIVYNMMSYKLVRIFAG